MRKITILSGDFITTHDCTSGQNVSLVIEGGKDDDGAFILVMNAARSHLMHAESVSHWGLW